MECVEVCDLKKFYACTTVETYLFVPEPLRNSDNRKISNFKTDVFCRSVIPPFAVQLFFIPF